MSTAAEAEYNKIISAGRDRISTHPEDAEADDASQTSSDRDGGTTLRSTGQQSLAPSAASSSTVMPTATYLSATTQFEANTGPKGVIADARSFETARKRSFRQTLYAFTDAPFRKLNGTNREKSKSPTPDLSADEEEDDFMRQWRQKRLDELASSAPEVRTRRQSPSKRRYGDLSTVDPAGYLDAVEKVGAETIVIVLIYDDNFPLSNQVEDSLRTLAQKHATTRFVKLHYEDAEMDEIAAPGILAYKGGECFANLVSFSTELPSGKDVTTSLVEETLQRHNIL